MEFEVDSSKHCTCTIYIINDSNQPVSDFRIFHELVAVDARGPTVRLLAEFVQRVFSEMLVAALIQTKEH